MNSTRKLSRRVWVLIGIAVALLVILFFTQYSTSQSKGVNPHIQVATTQGSSPVTTTQGP